jgi:hypothetical protein
VSIRLSLLPSYDTEPPIYWNVLTCCIIIIINILLLVGSRLNVLFTSVEIFFANLLLISIYELVRIIRLLNLILLHILCKEKYI